MGYGLTILIMIDQIYTYNTNTIIQIEIHWKINIVYISTGRKKSRQERYLERMCLYFDTQGFLKIRNIIMEKKKLKYVAFGQNSSPNSFNHISVL